MGFLSKSGPTHCIQASRAAVGAFQARLFMSNETFEVDEVETFSPLENFKETWDSFSSTNAYRTILLTGALLSSPRIREFLGLPICLGIFFLTWVAFRYESKFNDLCDVVTPKRQTALLNLRQAKARQLNAGASTKDDIKLLAAVYEKMLREELETRTIFSGLWYIEMGPDVEDRAAAPQLLGLRITDKYTLEPVD